MKKILFFAMMAVVAISLNTVSAQKVKLEVDANKVDANLLKTMEKNLSNLLVEINTAYDSVVIDTFRIPMIQDMPIDVSTQKTILRLWENAPFYCDQKVFTSRLWTFSNTYMAREIPITINQNGKDPNSPVNYQWAVVDFDMKGNIVDFRFAADGTSFESMDISMDVADIERRAIILQWCERFRTAYCEKDLKFIEQIFSEDAIIITGKVMNPKPGSSEVKLSPRVEYARQNKKQYLEKLGKCFKANRWIDVSFSPIIDEDGDTATMISQSQVNSNFYGVRFRQEWKSSLYSDKGYIFLLWDFTTEDRPIIHVRTWQPEYVGDRRLSTIEIFDIDTFDK